MGGLFSRSGGEALTGNITLEAVADKIRSGKVKNICFMTGAGISTAAGSDVLEAASHLYKRVGPSVVPCFLKPSNGGLK